MRQSLLIEEPDNQEWGIDMMRFLSQSRTYWIRTSAAIYLLQHGSDPGVRDEGERLLREILASNPSEPHTLWLLLKHCTSHPDFPGCASNDFAQRLIEWDAENAVLYLVPVTLQDVSAQPGIPDSEENRRALLSASRAHHFDVYHGRDALQLYRELKVFAGQYPPAHESDGDLPVHVRAYFYTGIVIMVEPRLGFSRLLNLCEAQAVEGRMDTVDACLTLARTLQETGTTLLTRQIGYTLELKVLQAMDGDVATYLYLQRKRLMSSEAIMCQVPPWLQGEGWFELEESTIVEHLADLGTVGEVDALRNAGTREFLVYPDRFEQNPARCADLMTLDSEAMGAALGELDPGLQQR